MAKRIFRADWGSQMQRRLNIQPTPMSIGDILSAVDEKSKSTQRIRLPRFQRGLVWSPQSRRDLVDSVLKGYPVGALLVHKQPDPDENRQSFLLIDGLQRTKALMEFEASPLKFIASRDVVSDEQLRELIEPLSLIHI